VEKWSNSKEELTKEYVMDKLKPQIALLFLDSEDEPIFG
jgi:hypothetical protein